MVVIQILAIVVFLALVFQVFGFAMGLRHAKRARERHRGAEEARGRRVVAEIPLADGAIALFTEDERSFAWERATIDKADVAGARLLLNGGILREFAREPGVLPAPVPPEEFEGRERWEVLVFLRSGGVARIACGTLREGVSREVAGRVYSAVELASVHSSRGSPSTT